ncbi:hypothetical protein [Sphingobium yanoikuyae]|uniref:hypothetical protein n=1 Tax=Sphingobium yanoikuyae TaxID=13690 RepID=UPI001F243863|nr:hypothetical protein [Sphingobium yanoikuyae]
MAFDPVDLRDIKVQIAEPGMPDPGVLQQPVMGGFTNRIGRLGGGHTAKFTLPPERMEPDGRKLVALAQMAKEYGALFEYPQVDFVVGTPGNGISISGAHAGGRFVAITGATPRYVIRQGQAFNVERVGHPYLYFAAAQTILDDNGAGIVPITRPLRRKLFGGEAVEIRRPVIAGWIVGDNFSWPIDMQRTVGLVFDVLERA